MFCRTAAVCIIEIASLVFNNACFMCTALTAQTVIEYYFTVILSVTLRDTEFIDSCSDSAFGVEGRIFGSTARCISSVSVQITCVRIIVGIGVMFSTAFLVLCRNRCNTWPYRISSSLPVILAEIAAAIEVCVNMTIPITWFLKVDIIIIAVYFCGAVGFCP